MSSGLPLSRQQELLAQGYKPYRSADGQVSWSRTVPSTGMKSPSDLDHLAGGTSGGRSSSPLMASTSLRPRPQAWNPARRSDASPKTAVAAKDCKSCSQDGAACEDSGDTQDATTPAVEPKSPPPSVDPDKIAEAIIAAIASDPRFKGPQGAPGSPGAPGPKGSDGKDGERGPVGAPGASPNIDIVVNQVMARMTTNESIAALAEKLPPIRVQVVDEAGKVVSSDVVSLGGVLTLRLKPKAVGAQ